MSSEVPPLLAEASPGQLQLTSDHNMDNFSMVNVSPWSKFKVSGMLLCTVTVWHRTR